MSREIEFRAWNKDVGEMYEVLILGDDYIEAKCTTQPMLLEHVELMQYTGLKDKNGHGLLLVYEGDIISKDGDIIGSIHEIQPRKTDLVVPQLGTKAWGAAYKEAVARGFDYSE